MAEFLISVIVTTCNRPDALDAVLRSLAHQRDRAFEVVVADDGSGPDTAKLVNSWQAEDLGWRLVHIWQERDGFRAAEVRNRAIVASRGEYCIFLDGDCLARPSFVASHRRLAERGWFVAGNRILFSKDLTAKVLREDITAECWSFHNFLREHSRGGVNRLAPLISLPFGSLRKWRPLRWQGARSCNLGIWRDDVGRVDGFDAAYSGWGREDSDLLARLLHAGIRRKDGTYATGVLHLWHPPADRSQLSDNDRKFETTRQERRIKAIRGLSTLSRAKPPQ